MLYKYLYKEHIRVVSSILSKIYMHMAFRFRQNYLNLKIRIIVKRTNQ